ncbi:MAG: transporter substrate-binding domain-containing protein, partial [Elainellaceae cyanobacterium]
MQRWVRDFAVMAIFVTTNVPDIILGQRAITPLSFFSRASAAELSDIQQRGYLIVGVKDNIRPLGFRNPQGELVGLEIEIARHLAQDLLGDSDAVVLQPVANADRMSALLNDEVDVVIAQMGRTEARSRLVNFSYPYYLDGTGLVTRSFEIQQFSDLAGRTLAVLNHSTTIDIVRYRIPGATLVGVESYEEALTLLDAGEADAFAGDLTVLAGWVQEYPAYRILPTPLSAEALAIALPRGLDHEPLRQAINQAIEQWTQSGWL